MEIKNNNPILLSPTPTYFSSKLTTEIAKKGTFASPATAIALANNAFPDPGGPYNKIPRGNFAPIFLYLFGFFK